MSSWDRGQGLRAGLPLRTPQHAVDQLQRTVGAGRKVRIVRDDHEARADRAIQLQHQLEHLTRRAAVEVARGLVGKHAPGLGHERPGERHALPLAAGQLPGKVPHAMLEAHAIQHPLGCRPRRRHRHPPDHEGHRDVLQRGEFRQQMMELVDEAQRAVAHGAALLFGERGEIDSLHAHFARGRRVEAAEKVEQRALAGPGSADDRHALASRDGQIDAEQHRHLERAADERLAESAAGEHRPRRGRRFTHTEAPPPDSPSRRATRDRRSRSGPARARSPRS